MNYENNRNDSKFNSLNLHIQTKELKPTNNNDMFISDYNSSESEIEQIDREYLESNKIRKVPSRSNLNSQNVGAISSIFKNNTISGTSIDSWSYDDQDTSYPLRNVEEEIYREEEIVPDTNQFKAISTHLSLDMHNLSVSNSRFEDAKTPSERYNVIPIVKTIFKKDRNSLIGLKRSNATNVDVLNPTKIQERSSDISMTDNNMRLDSIDEDDESIHQELVILECIDSGSFGSVYRVEDRSDNRFYALKRLKRAHMTESEKVYMMNEVHALQYLSQNASHDEMKTIVKYYSSWNDEENLSIQLELCETSLEKQILHGGIVNDNDIMNIFYDMLLALRVLHKHRLVHLDIKPANILKHGNRWKLGDFGRTIQLDSNPFVEEGDCKYMANELLHLPVADLTKCDIFSLGITLYEISNRVTLEINGSQWHALRNHTFSFIIDLSKELREIIYILLSPLPENRPTAQECLQRYFNKNEY